MTRLLLLDFKLFQEVKHTTLQKEMLPFLLLPSPPKLSSPVVQRRYIASLPSSFAKSREKKKIKNLKRLGFFFPPSISNTIRIPKSELLFLRYFLNYTVLIRKWTVAAITMFPPMQFSHCITNSLTNWGASSTRAAIIYRTVMRVKFIKRKKCWWTIKIRNPTTTTFNSASQHRNYNPTILK